MNNTRCRVSVNNAYISDHGSFHFLLYYLYDTDVGSSYTHIIFIRSRTVTEIKPTVPEQNVRGPLLHIEESCNRRIFDEFMWEVSQRFPMKGEDCNT